jgi:hypothetical protein
MAYDDRLAARVRAVLAHARPMDFTGRALRGFVTVDRERLAGRALARWVKEVLAWVESLPPKQ